MTKSFHTDSLASARYWLGALFIFYRPVSYSSIHPSRSSLSSPLPPPLSRVFTQEGRPVLYQLYGTEFDAKKLEEMAGLSGQDLADYYTWMLERTLKIMGTCEHSCTLRTRIHTRDVLTRQDSFTGSYASHPPLPLSFSVVCAIFAQETRVRG